MLKEVTHIIVHCSATPAGMDIGIKEIDRWHRKRGWLKVGYHFVIKREGNIQAGRKLTETGAHVRGYNQRSIGICLVGGMGDDGGAEDNFTDKQMETLRQNLWYMTQMFPKAVVFGHNQLDPKKDCPCFDLEKIPGFYNHFNQTDSGR